MSVILWISLILISSFAKELICIDVLADGMQYRLQYRLPNDTRPKSYDIYISTNIHNGSFAFEGTVSILLEVVSETSSITLHSHRERTIADISLNENTMPIPIGIVSFNSDSELLTIPLHTGKKLERNKRYTLNIVFSGTLQEQMRGFYRSSYNDSGGNVRFLATTQFALTDARHAFPCYDEPSFRANFTIKIRHGSSYHAVSNMPINGTPKDDGNGMTTTTFMTTPSSATYVLAYTISDYDYVSNLKSSSGSIPIRTYARTNTKSGASYSIEVGGKLLKAYTDYFGVKYALPKIDQVVFTDFPFETISNWGMVVYREPDLLIFPNSTHATKTRITTIIANAFAHQWFGNLVTPKWWSYVWLSEGFSALFENLATNWIYPKWKITDYYVYNTLQSVFQYDAEDTTRPMSFYTEIQDEVLQLLDNVASAKASCVLRMIMHAITEKVFKKGLTNYFNARAYLAADENDLFEAIADSILENDPSENNVNISTFMSSWTQQKGYPFLTITRHYNSRSITIRQERYQSYIPTQIDPTMWWIPYNFASASSIDFLNTSAKGWLSDTDRIITLTKPSKLDWKKDDWVIFNKQQTGYYRVLYDYENYKLITKELVKGNLTKIHLTSRSQLIDDAFNLAKSGRLSYSVVFELIIYLENEREYVPWASAFRGLEFIHRMLAASTSYHYLQDFTLGLVEKLFNYTGIKDRGDKEPHFNKELRILATNWACRMGSYDCLESTHLELRRNWKKIHSNMRPTIYCNGLRSNVASDFSRLKNLLNRTSDLSERNIILTALGCYLDESKLNNYIESSVGDSYMSKTENYRVFTSVLENGQPGLKVAMRFLENYLFNAADAYGTTNINNAMIATANNIVTTENEEKFTRIMQMATANSYLTVETIARIQRILQENKNWRTNYQEYIGNWLENFYKTISFSVFIVVATALIWVFLSFLLFYY